MSLKLTNDIFLSKAKMLHDNFYDYSLAVYVNYNTKVKIICPIHGVFEQTPNVHLNGHGCTKCGVSKKKNIKKTLNEFISEANKVHLNKYDYSSSIYEGAHMKIKIICPIHGVFEQTPNTHLRNCGCKKCGDLSTSNKLSMSIEVFLDKAKILHSDKYDYSLVKYLNSYSKIKIICPIHGLFEQTPNTHLNGHGCLKCSIGKNTKNKIKDNDSFIYDAKKIHGNKYDYSLTNYIGCKDNIKIICLKHGEFEQLPNGHLNGNGCQKCGLFFNKTENYLKSFIESLSINFVENSKTIITPLELDIYIPSHNLAIEFNGLYWHSELYKDNDYHLNKTIECEKQGIQLIHIFEDEWLYKKDIVKSRLKNILGLTQHKIYGRKTQIKEVLSKHAKLFLDNNHIQGNINSKIKLGLYHDNELVSLMTFGSLRKSMGRKNKEDSYELLRFCNKLNTSVIGGADKLLKHFIKTHQPKEIISYADRRWSQGNLYEKLGFEFIHNSRPNYYYVKGVKRDNRFKYRKDVLIKQGFDSTKTEKEIMKERKINRIYDCGCILYKYNHNTPITKI